MVDNLAQYILPDMGSDLCNIATPSASIIEDFSYEEPFYFVMIHE